MRDLERHETDLAGKGETDYGPGGVFEHLSRTVYECKPGGQFSYEVCPYHGSKQKDSSGGSTAIGTWEGFGKDEAEASAGGEGRYLTMRFGNGQHCWNAGARTLTVALECAAESSVLSVDEPEVCKYAMRFATPAACTSAHLEAAKLDLQALQPDAPHDEL